MSLSAIAKTKSWISSISYSWTNQRVGSLLKILLASLFIGISAQIEIPLYFTPVPLTVQTPAVMLVGIILGSRKGAFATLCYLLEGSVGLPVWAGGSSGIVHLLGPTGGYLFGFVILAYLSGWLLEKQKNLSLFTITAALLISTLVHLSIGSLWLAQFVGIENSFKLGFHPFIFGDVAKALLLAIYVKNRQSRTLKSQI